MVDQLESVRRQLLRVDKHDKGGEGVEYTTCYGKLVHPSQLCAMGSAPQSAVCYGKCAPVSCVLWEVRPSPLCAMESVPQSAVCYGKCAPVSCVLWEVRPSPLCAMGSAPQSAVCYGKCAPVSCVLWSFAQP